MASGILYITGLLLMYCKHHQLSDNAYVGYPLRTFAVRVAVMYKIMLATEHFLIVGPSLQGSVFLGMSPEAWWSFQAFITCCTCGLDTWA